MTQEELKQAIKKEIAELSTGLKDLALILWNHPELSGEEFFAAETLCKYLTEHDIPVTPGFRDMPTAFRTEIGAGEHCFGIAAEYDALPDIGHGCGHNLIAAAAMGASCAVAKILKQNSLPGRLAIIGTPAEEYGGGKVKLIERNVLDGVEAVMMTHPTHTTKPDTGSTAIYHYNVTFHGVAAHAAGAPELGKNALDAVMLLFAGINAFRQQMPEFCRIHGIVSEGGVKPNIIPEKASCQFFLRSTKEAWMKKLVQRFQDIVKGAALMTDTTFEIALADVPYRSRKPNASLNRKFLEMMQFTATGETSPNRGSSDFGDFSRVVPGAHPYFGIAENRIPGHSREFAEAARSERGLDAMLHAAESLAYTALSFLTDAEFRSQVKADFDNWQE